MKRAVAMLALLLITAACERKIQLNVPAGQEETYTPLIGTLTLDTSFQNTGEVELTDSERFYATQFIPTADGRVIVVLVYNGRFKLLRLNRDGSLDTTFDTRGLGSERDSFSALEETHLAADGKLYLVIRRREIDITTYKVTRLLSNGEIDTSFNGTGSNSHTFSGNSQYYASALLSDGTFTIAARVIFDTNRYLHLLRFSESGELQPIVRGSRLDEESAKLRFLADGQLIGASVDLGGSEIRVRAFRYSAEGIVDESYGLGGINVSQFSEIADMALLPNGKILVINDPDFNDAEVRLMQFDGDGSPDASFGDGGTKILNFDRNVAALGLEPLSNGKVLIGLLGVEPFTASLALIQANGEFDTVFAATGEKTIPLSLTGPYTTAIASTPDGKVLLGIYSEEVGERSPIIARLKWE